MQPFRLTAFLVLGSLIVGCAGGEDADPPADEQDVVAGTRLIGRWRSTKDTYAKDIRFENNGTFIGEINRPLMGGAPCAAAPCTNIVLGKWRAAPGGKLILTIPKVVEVTAGKTLTLDFKVASSPKALELRGENGEQTLQFHPGCSVVKCGSGESCAEQPDGTTACVRPVPHN